MPRYALIDKNLNSVFDVVEASEPPSGASAAYLVVDITNNIDSCLINRDTLYDVASKTFIIPDKYRWRAFEVKRRLEIEELEFEYARNSRETRMGKTPTRSKADMQKLDVYIQLLCDIPVTGKQSPPLELPPRPSPFPSCPNPRIV